MARGLDPACWAAAKKDGTLHTYPQVRRTPADIVAEYEHLIGCGESESSVARRLGYAHVRSMRKNVARARALVVGASLEVAA
jgi:hypothetical protein